MRQVACSLLAFLFLLLDWLYFRIFLLSLQFQLLQFKTLLCFLGHLKKRHIEEAEIEEIIEISESKANIKEGIEKAQREQAIVTAAETVVFLNVACNLINYFIYE